MGEMEYKSVPLPTTPRKFKGVKNPVDRASRTFSEILNEQAQGGWSYLRAEQVEVAVPTGMLRRKSDVAVTLLVFGRPRAEGARISATRRAEPQAAAPITREPQIRAADPQPGLRSTD